MHVTSPGPQADARLHLENKKSKSTLPTARRAAAGRFVHVQEPRTPTFLPEVAGG